MIPQPEEWLHEFVAEILKRHPEIEQVYLLGKGARGPQGQKPNYSLLFYAGYDRALELMGSLARLESELRPFDGIVHLYVENYGATFCGLWGGSLISNEINAHWMSDSDYEMLLETGNQARILEERLRLPEERRKSVRRLQLEEFFSDEDDIDALDFGADQLERPASERRELPERRRDLQNLQSLLQDD